MTHDTVEERSGVCRDTIFFFFFYDLESGRRGASLGATLLDTTPTATERVQ